MGIMEATAQTQTIVNICFDCRESTSLISKQDFERKHDGHSIRSLLIEHGVA